MDAIKRGYGQVLLLFFAGAFAGLLNGLVGCGGGIVLVYVLTRAYRGSPERDSRDVFASAVASVLPMSAVSALIYLRSGDPVSAAEPGHVVPALCGGIVGAYLLDRISLPWLRRIFALLVIWAGTSLVLRGTGIL